MEQSRQTTVYPARRILTMSPRAPEADAIAIRAGRVLAVGSLEDVLAWSDGGHVDRRFEDCVLMPGLVEGHAHTLEGGFWDYPYVGYYDRVAPDGVLWGGLTSIEDVVERLRAEERKLEDPTTPLFTWGFDPILFGGRRMTTDDLDAVATTRPIVVLHASIHSMNTNSAGLAAAGLDRDSELDGMLRHDSGAPTGELAEFAAMFLVFDALGIDLFGLGSSQRAVENYGRVANIKGVTTITDLINDLTPATVSAFKAVTDREDCPIRLIPALNGLSTAPDKAVARMRELAGANTSRLRFQMVKLMTDGAIQGYTARLNWPGYFDGHPNGIWNTTPEQLAHAIDTLHDAGLQLHIHTNGDEASDLTLDLLQAALARNPRPGHRHTLQHAQLVGPAQVRRMRELGCCVNLFANHLYYWGDIHLSHTLGPDRARRMDAVGTALHYGVPAAIHCDAPVTPLSPFFTAWCAVNRQTSGRQILGEGERIGVRAALEMITLGAAYTLQMDDEIGSLETGKRADVAVLEDDPETLGSERLHEVRVRGTLRGGQWFPAPGSS